MMKKTILGLGLFFVLSGTAMGAGQVERLMEEVASLPPARFIDYSLRMEALGVDLVGILKDDYTDLFLNPADIDRIDTGFFYFYPSPFSGDGFSSLGLVRRISSLKYGLLLQATRTEDERMDDYDDSERSSDSEVEKINYTGLLGGKYGDLLTWGLKLRLTDSLTDRSRHDYWDHSSDNYNSSQFSVFKEKLDADLSEVTLGLDYQAGLNVRLGLVGGYMSGSGKGEFEDSRHGITTREAETWKRKDSEDGSGSGDGGTAFAEGRVDILNGEKRQRFFIIGERGNYEVDIDGRTSHFNQTDSAGEILNKERTAESYQQQIEAEDWRICVGWGEKWKPREDTLLGCGLILDWRGWERNAAKAGSKEIFGEGRSIDSDYQETEKGEGTRIVIKLPLGVELEPIKILSMRFGMRMRIVIEREEKNDRVIKKTFRKPTDYTFGLGYNWGKGISFDLVTSSELTNINYWRIACTYRF